MPSLADYKVLHSEALELKSDGTTIRDKVLELEWVPPPRFVKGTTEARPVLTYQLWTIKPSKLTIAFKGVNAPTVTNFHVRGPVAGGQLIVGNALFHGPHLAEKGDISITADFFDNQQASHFWVELVTIMFQRFR